MSSDPQTPDAYCATALADIDPNRRTPGEFYKLAWNDAGDIGLAEQLTHEEIRAALGKAAGCLRGGETHTFTGAELDAVRHYMPAHQVHQSVAARFVSMYWPVDDDNSSDNNA